MATTAELIQNIQSKLAGNIQKTGLDAMRSDVNMSAYKFARHYRDDMFKQTLDTSIAPREELDMIDIPENEVLAQSADVAMRLMSGELDPETKASIEQFSAEIAASGGVGLSQTASAYTARNIGLTKEALIQSGAQLGVEVGMAQDNFRMSLATLNASQAQFNENAKTAWAQLELDMTKFQDSFQLAMAQHDLDVEQVRLGVYEIISSNEKTTESLINDLIIQNSRQEIEGVQQNIDQLNESISGKSDAIAGAFL